MWHTRKTFFHNLDFLRGFLYKISISGWNKLFQFWIMVVIDTHWVFIDYSLSLIWSYHTTWRSRSFFYYAIVQRVVRLYYNIWRSDAKLDLRLWNERIRGVFEVGRWHFVMTFCHVETKICNQTVAIVIYPSHIFLSQHL